MVWQCWEIAAVIVWPGQGGNCFSTVFSFRFFKWFALEMTKMFIRQRTRKSKRNVVRRDEGEDNEEEILPKMQRWWQANDAPASGFIALDTGGPCEEVREAKKMKIWRTTPFHKQRDGDKQMSTRTHFKLNGLRGFATKNEPLHKETLNLLISWVF